MPQSTPIDSLQSESTADEERVKRILSEMNAGDSVQAPPALAPMPRVISEPPLSTSTGELRMDSGTARAHIIGNSAPSMADFQSMFYQTPPGMAPIHGASQPPPLPKAKPVQSTWGTVSQNLRGPIIVAAIVFLLNLPIVTTILSRYAAWMYLGSGEISISGLFVKSLLGGALFAVYQTISMIFDA